MKGKKGLVILLAVVLVIGSSFSTGFAQSSIKTIQGWFDNDIKLYNNGVQVNLQNTPIIHQKDGAAGGTTYVAIRELGELLDKTVTWDQATYSAYIVDKPGQNYQSMLMEIIEKQEKIVTLEAKVSELEKEVKELKEAKEDKVSNLYDLEKTLNSRYGTYERVRLDIILKGDKDDVKVEAKIYSADRNDWEYLTISKRKALVEDIVYDIQREYSNAKVTGYVDGGYGDTSLDFYTDSRGYVNYYGTGTGSGSGRYLTESQMEDYLEDIYFYDVDEVYVWISGGYIYVDVDLYYDLNYSDIRKMVNNMKSDISREMNVYESDIYIDVYYDKVLVWP